MVIQWKCVSYFILGFVSCGLLLAIAVATLPDYSSQTLVVCTDD